MKKLIFLGALLAASFSFSAQAKTETVFIKVYTSNDLGMICNPCAVAENQIDYTKRALENHGDWDLDIHISQVERSAQQLEAMGIDGVPTIAVVNANTGKRVTSKGFKSVKFFAGQVNKVTDQDLLSDEEVNALLDLGTGYIPLD